MDLISLLKYRNIVNNRDGRFEQIALTTSVSSMLLTIIAAMNIWSYFGTLIHGRTSHCHGDFPCCCCSIFSSNNIWCYRLSSSLQQQEEYLDNHTHLAAIKYRSEHCFTHSRDHDFYLMVCYS
ncbi:hypothetical protein P8452_24062 [Trifolium repens]|nr:hypothetical protein P8452_24062 [Trifolium repens]